MPLIEGDDRDNRIRGAHGAYTIFANAGDDRLRGLGGDDWLYGGAGEDNLYGGAGDDVLNGGAGADTVLGGEGDDTIVGGSSPRPAADHIDGGLGFDVLSYAAFRTAVTISLNNIALTGEGDALLQGLEGAIGGRGDDTITGSGGGDRLEGGAGDDQLNGAAGNDTLNGDKGDDRLSGGGGRDVLTGGLGADTMLGGLNADLFVFQSVQDSRAGAADLIADLKLYETVDLAAVDADSGADGDQAFTLVQAFTGHAGELTVAYAGPTTSPASRETLTAMATPSW